VLRFLGLEEEGGVWESGIGKRGFGSLKMDLDLERASIISVPESKLLYHSSSR